MNSGWPLAKPFSRTASDAGAGVLVECGARCAGPGRGLVRMILGPGIFIGEPGSLVTISYSYFPSRAAEPEAELRLLLVRRYISWLGFLQTFEMFEIPSQLEIRRFKSRFRLANRILTGCLKS